MPETVLIQNARVVDGTGSPWFRADLAIRDRWICAVGRCVSMAGATVVDAADRYLAPGFIDAHAKTT
jgi:N-acyl-D-amino-acid deacylase